MHELQEAHAATSPGAMPSRTAMRMPMYAELRERISKETSQHGLQVLLRAAQERVHDAKRLKWKAYEQSFQADVDLITARLSAVMLERYMA